LRHSRMSNLRLGAPGCVIANHGRGAFPLADLGGFYDFTEHHHLLFSAGTGIQNADQTNGFSYYLGCQLTF
jgi:hypothetical protein